MTDKYRVVNTVTGKYDVEYNERDGAPGWWYWYSTHTYLWAAKRMMNKKIASDKKNSEFNQKVLYGPLP